MMHPRPGVSSVQALGLNMKWAGSQTLWPHTYQYIYIYIYIKEETSCEKAWDSAKSRLLWLALLFKPSSFFFWFTSYYTSSIITPHPLSRNGNFSLNILEKSKCGAREFVTPAHFMLRPKACAEETQGRGYIMRVMDGLRKWPRTSSCSACHKCP